MSCTKIERFNARHVVKRNSSKGLNRYELLPTFRTFISVLHPLMTYKITKRTYYTSCIIVVSSSNDVINTSTQLQGHTLILISH